MIVPDQKVTVGALNAVVWMVVECVKNTLGTAEGCVPADTPTLKSVEIREWGLRGEEDSTLGTSTSPLYIEVEGCRVVVMAHQALAVTKSWEV